MLQNLADRVDLLVLEVKQIEAESEDVYLKLGRLFPSLLAETKRSTENAQHSLAGFRSLTDSGSADSIRSMREFAAESGRYFRAINERDLAFLGRINESIERLSSLEGLIGGARLDSEEMEIISLNAMTVALKSGASGKAFSVITDELKRLSSKTISLTEEITTRGRSLLDYFARLRDSLKELDEFQSRFFGELDRALSSGFGELESEVVEAIKFFSTLIGEAAGLREPIQAIMQGVQLQDILRQSLEHVAISLDEARSAARKENTENSDEELAYVGAIAELSTSLLDDVVEKLDASTAAFRREIEKVRTEVETQEEKRVGFRRNSATHSESLDASHFSDGSSHYLALKKEVIETAKRLAEQVRELDESFKGLAALLSRFQNIVVASRIEVARNKALAGVTTTVHGMITLTGRIEADVSGAMSTTKDFIKIAVAAISEYAEEGRAAGFSSSAVLSGRELAGRELNQGNGILEVLKRIERDMESLEKARKAAAESIEGFILFTPEFIALIAEARGSLERLGALSTRLRSIRGALANLQETARGALGPRVEKAIRSDRLRAMIERFTIFTHKKTAGTIGNFAVEGGADAGDITLF